MTLGRQQEAATKRENYNSHLVVEACVISVSSRPWAPRVTPRDKGVGVGWGRPTEARVCTPSESQRGGTKLEILLDDWSRGVWDWPISIQDSREPGKGME